MGKQLGFDYYYGIEAEQFSFYRVPRMLVKDERFKDLSSDAKLLYGLMLDRMSLSMKHGWLDAENRAYIYYTMEDVMEDLGCAKEKCNKVLAELDSKKGIGLIEKKRQGLGKPDMIYVKNFASLPKEKDTEISEDEEENPEVRKSNFKKYDNCDFESMEMEFAEVETTDFYEQESLKNVEMQAELGEKAENSPYMLEDDFLRSMETELAEVGESNFKKFGNRTSRGSEIELAEVRKSNPNYTDINYTDLSYTEDSYNNPIHLNPIYPSDGMEDGCDGLEESSAYISLIKKNIEYDLYMQDTTWKDRELYEELFQLICDVVCVKRKSVRIGGEDYPYEVVKSKFLKLNHSHLDYVMYCIQHATTKIGNIKAYMITALYNAPNTINHYYRQLVQHDMYGGGWEENGIV